MDFDTPINRYHTNSLKYDFAVENGYPADVLPLWVADMDFRVPEPVQKALSHAVQHGIFGYSDTKQDYFDAVAHWFQSRFHWSVEADWLVKTPGVVFALATAVRALTNPGDAVLIQPPVYRPFSRVVLDNGRKLVESPLLLQDGQYRIDFADLEQKIVENQVRLFLLCSPHNPVGRVWTRAELEALGSICKRHSVFVVSDEIHCDFAFPTHPHTVFLDANPSLAAQTIICTAPSKTFNLAGLQISNIWIPDSVIRKAFCTEMQRVGYSHPNALGIVACQAAYSEGADWLAACTAYLRENLNFLRHFLQTHLPQLHLIEPEGTYFAWVDCSRLGLDSRSLNNLIQNQARLWLDAGSIFGACAKQFQRIVLACPRSTLEQALLQLETAIRSQ